MESTQRRRGPRSPASNYRGVTCYKRTGRWEAHIWVGDESTLLATSSTTCGTSARHVIYHIVNPRSLT